MTLSRIALGGVPLILAVVVVYGVWRKVAVYECFVEGAKQGLRTAVDILPAVAAAFVLISLLRSSGLLDLLTDFLRRPLEALGLPQETLPLLLLRPVSGSASLAVLEDIFKETGPDSYPARVASAMMGSTETVLYTIAVYLGAAGIKKSKGILPVALLASFAGSVAAGFFTRFF